MTTITKERKLLMQALDALETCAGAPCVDRAKKAVREYLAAPATAQAAEIERLKTESEERLQNCAALVAENEQLRKDAERYRWLRGDSCPDHSVRWVRWEVRCWKAPFWTADLRREELDAAIDTAMRETP